MVLQGVSNVLNTTMDVKSLAQGSITRDNKIVEQNPSQKNDQWSKDLSVFATAQYDQINFQEGDAHLDYILQSSVQNKVVFEAHATQSDNELFEETGRILFGGSEHVLYISTLGSGQLLGSPAPGYKQGALTFQVNGGTGLFEKARGMITANFLVGELGDYQDAHTATIFLQGKAEDSIAEEKRLLVRDVIDEKAFPVMIDASMEYVADLLALTNASELMVIDGEGNFIGVVSEVDLLQALIPDIDEILKVGGTLKEALNIFIRNGRDLAGQRISRLVKSNPRTVRPDDELLAVATVMLQGDVRRLPVIEHGKFVGSISLADICWAILSKWNGIRQN
jgi:predicted transcriptional regulator